MFAIIVIGGKQYKVREKDELEVEKLDVGDSDSIKFKEVLLLADDEGKSVKIGMPYVTGVHVECKILEADMKGEKIQVRKFKAKKRYSKVQGHRQRYTTLKVLKISAVEKKAAPVEKSEKVEEAAPKKVVKKPAAKKAD